MTGTIFNRLSATLPYLLFEKKGKLLRSMRSELLEQVTEYPSVINNGYLHIERVIQLSHHLGVSEDCPIVDVGAASGDTALLFSENFPNTPIYCFEPIKSSYEKLLCAIAGQAQIKARNVALGSAQGRSKMIITNRINSSSILPIAKELQSEYLAENIRAVGEEIVEVLTLDAALEDIRDTTINILKIDVQGYELEVLKGGSRTIPKICLILVEVQNHSVYTEAPSYYDVDAFLRKVGFTLFDIVPSIRLNKKMYEWDAIYVNNQIAKNYFT